MSSGFFGFYAHAGMLKALEQEDLHPAAVAGSSAGALVAGMYAAGMSAADLCEELVTLERREFWDPWPGLGLLRGHKFRRRLEQAIGTRDFSECRVPLAVSVFDVAARKTDVIKAGDVASAVVASCALPILIQPQRRGGRLYSDGGILDRPGLLGLEQAPRVLHHHLVSRSPWRRKNSKALEAPARDGLVALLLPDLPRLGPFRLERGRMALKDAYQRTRAALDLEAGPVVHG